MFTFPDSLVPLSQLNAPAGTCSGKAAGKCNEKKPRPQYLSAFSPDIVVSGYHVFANGACVPNPGTGGWGSAVYVNGREIASNCGGDQMTMPQTIRWNSRPS